jgi:CIC family chloride channel protein
MVQKKAVPVKSLKLLSLTFLAVLVGGVAGLGAVVFRGLIALFHNLLFLGKFSYVYDANAHTPPSPWGALVILVPVAGAVGVVFLVKNFAPEAKGHGVPEVMDAIYYNKGVIRPVVALIKSIASALSIGSGGSVGREGPIIQIGASFGSTIAQLLKISVWQRITLIAAGAGGGIAATFNTPIGGILFAIEIMMYEISVRTLIPVSIATVTATYVGRRFFGAHPSFVVPELRLGYFPTSSPWVLLIYVGLGLLMGGVSILYIKSIYGFEDFFEKRIKSSEYIRHMTGMALVGATMYLLMRTFGHYYIEGVGYAAVQDVLTGHLDVILLLLLLFALKLLAVSLTLGSGASGGIFSPGLFMGATLGGAYGLILKNIFPSLDINPAALAVAGMAGVISGSTGAAMTAVVMIFEMTLDYNVLAPMAITVAISYGIRKRFSRTSIYTQKLVRRGHFMPEALQTDFHLEIRSRDAMEGPIKSVPATLPLGEFAEMVLKERHLPYFLIEDSGRVVEVISRETALEAMQRGEQEIILSEVGRKDYINVPETARLLDVMSQLRSTGAEIALVVGDLESDRLDDVRGYITKERIADVMAESKELFMDG